jgi:hypothetical protein
MGGAVLMRAVMVLVSLLSASCLRDTSFKCSTNAECGTGGTCEPSVNYCSVADTECASGARFGSSAGSYANRCVGDNGGADGGTDSTTSDAPADAPVVGCPGDYVTISGGQGNHRYRLVNMSENWQMQRAFCTSTTSSAYLAIPDDIGELTAIATLSAASQSWVGVSDTATENTFVTVKNLPQTFLPWDTGQPDDAGPGEDCVVIQTSSSKLRDERCGNKLRAVCECEP